MTWTRWLATVGFTLLLAAGTVAGTSEHRRSGTTSGRTVVIGSVTPEYLPETSSWRTPLYVNITGTWNRKKGWQRLDFYERGEEAVAHRLAPEGTRWRLYRVGAPIAAASSRRAVVVPGDTEEVETSIDWPRIHAPLEGTPGEVGKAFLAVSGAGRIDRPSLRVFPPEDEWAKPLVSAALRKLGKRPDFRVMQNVGVDLDRDGRTDRVVAISFGADPGSGAMIFAMFDRGHGNVRTVVVRETTDELWGPISGASILAVADIDDDGFREIAIEVYAPDLSAYEVYCCDGKRFKRALVWRHAE